MGAPSVLVFDIGRVLIRFDFERCFERWSEFTGKPVSHFREAFDMESEAYKEHERGERDGEDYNEYLNSHFQVSLSYQQFTEAWGAIFLGEVPGMRGLIEALSGRARLVALSNTNELHRQALFRLHSELLRPFEKIYISSDLGCRKPEREIYDRVAEDLSVSASELLFFDDTPTNVVGARAAGWRAELFESTDSARKILEAHFGLFG